MTTATATLTQSNPGPITQDLADGIASASEDVKVVCRDGRLVRASGLVLSLSSALVRSAIDISPPGLHGVSALNLAGL